MLSHAILCSFHCSNSATKAHGRAASPNKSFFVHFIAQIRPQKQPHQINPPLFISFSKFFPQKLMVERPHQKNSPFSQKLFFQTHLSLKNSPFSHFRHRILDEKEAKECELIFFPRIPASGSAVCKTADH